MADVYPLPIGKDSDSLVEFKKKLLSDHKESLIIILDEAIKRLREYGFEINKKWKRNSLRKLTKELYELRPHKIRLLLYFDGDNFFILLHGFLKETQKTPKSEIQQAEREIKKWKEIKSALFQSTNQTKDSHH